MSHSSLQGLLAIDTEARLEALTRSPAPALLKAINTLRNTWSLPALAKVRAHSWAG